MPSRKTEHIVAQLREEILSGERPFGSKLPTYDALVEQFQVTRPTVARVLNQLREIYSQLKNVSGFHSGIQEALKRIDSSQIELKDIYAELESISDAAQLGSTRPCRSG